jgi:hypothetical protein
MNTPIKVGRPKTLTDEEIKEKVKQRNEEYRKRNREEIAIKRIAREYVAKAERKIAKFTKQVNEWNQANPKAAVEIIHYQPDETEQKDENLIISILE